MKYLPVFKCYFTRPAWLLVMLLSSHLFTASAWAQDESPSPQIGVKAWLEPSENIVVSQQVDLIIEVATPQWFTGGTTISEFEIDGAVILRRERFAVNLSRREGGTSWAVQRWAIAIYPQRVGNFTVPQLDLTVMAANTDAQSTQYQLSTPSINFVAIVPDAVSALGDAMQPQSSTTGSALGNRAWLAANNFSLRESYSKATNNLTVGDSITRVIELTAENTAAMMLPAIRLQAQEGLALYPKPHKIDDSVNRGETIATRTQRMTYVIEKPGSYTLPAHTLYWWNLETDSLETLGLPAQIISTGALSQYKNSTKLTEDRSGIRFSTLIIGLALIGIALILYYLISQWRRRPLSPSKAAKREMSVLESDYKAAIDSNNYTKAISIFYAWLSTYQRLQISKSDQYASDTGHAARQQLEKLRSPTLRQTFEYLMLLGNTHRPTDTKNKPILKQLISDLKKSLKKQPIQATPNNADSNNPFRLN